MRRLPHGHSQIYLIQVFSSESYPVLSHIPGDRACAKTTDLVLCDWLYVSVYLKVAPCPGTGDDKQGAENFCCISRSLNGTVVLEREEASVSSHSSMSKIRACLFRAPFLLLGKI